jgi:4-aminobutyrate--pyruvate transaminase
LVAKACEAAGLIVRPLFDNRLGVCPPLVIQESEIDELLVRLKKGLDDGHASAKEKGLLT